MDFHLSRVQVWSAEIPDQPGGSAKILEALAKADANLEFIWSRRIPEKQGRGAVYLAPVTGPAQTKAAHAVGLHKADDQVLLKIEGTDRPGVAHFLASCLASAGINLRGMSMAAMAGHFVAYVACDSPEDAAKAVQALAALQV